MFKTKLNLLLRNSFLLLAVFILLILSACDKNSASRTDKPVQSAMEHAQKHIEPGYICPMHAQIISAEAGSCPICGMALVRQPVKSQEPSANDSPVIPIDANIIQSLGIRTAVVKKGSLSKLLKTVGYVKYNKRRVTMVRSQTSGWVENLAFRTEGQMVKKGSLLLELYSPEFLAVQKRFLDAQQKDQSGILKKYGQREESVVSRDHLRYLNVSESLVNEIARSGKPRHRIPVYAPQHGMLVRHNVHKHMFVTPGYPMFAIADMSSIWVEADIYEHQLSWLRRKLSAEVEIQALPGKKWPARVNYIYPELDSRSRTLRVRLLVPTPDGLLRPNMFAQVKIFSDPITDVLLIPREALIVTGERQSVILDRGEGRFQPVDVVTGLHSQGEVEVISGLQEGDRIVLSGQFLIDSEAHLQASFRRLGTPHE